MPTALHPFSRDQTKAMQSNVYLLKQAGYMAAIQLMWACGITACALRVASEYPFTDLGGTAAGSWLLAVGCWLLAVGCWLLAAGCWLLAAGCWLLAAALWLVVPTTGFEPKRVDLTRFETLCLNHSGTPPTTRPPGSEAWKRCE